jgi:two-component system sensor histidine kinase NreB
MGREWDGRPFVLSYDEGVRLATLLREEFGLDFAAVSLLGELDNERTLTWNCVAGNTNDRYKRIFLPDGVGVLGMVYSACRPLLVCSAEDDIAREDLFRYPIIAAEGLESLVAFPLADLSGRDDPGSGGDAGTAQPRDIRAICLCASRSPQAFCPEDLMRLRSRAAQATGLVAAGRGYMTPGSQGGRAADSSTVAHRVIRAQEDERKRIARELHDGLAQELLLVQIELRKSKYLGPQEKDAAIDEASERLRQCMRHISSITADLRPESLDELGLAAAISAHCVQVQRGFGVRVDRDVRDVGPLSSDVMTALYRIYQEAISNACKYSRSDSVSVSLRREGDEVELAVRDFGVGFDPGAPTVRGGGLGLLGMRERVDALGGTLTIESRLGAGTEVRVRIDAEGGK